MRFIRLCVKTGADKNYILDDGAEWKDISRHCLELFKEYNGMGPDEICFIPFHISIFIRSI